MGNCDSIRREVGARLGAPSLAGLSPDVCPAAGQNGADHVRPLGPSLRGDDGAAAALPEGPSLSVAETTFRWLARPYGFLDECAATHGDAFTVRFGHFGTHVVLTDPDDVRDVLTADRNALHAGRGNAPLEPLMGEHSLLLLDGDRHAARRALLQPDFSRDRARDSARIVAEATRRRIATWPRSGNVSIQRTALEISREVILRAVCDVDELEIERLGRLIDDLTALGGTNAAFDDTCEDARLLARFRATRGALGDALQEHVDRRRRDSAPGGADVLSTMVAAADSAPALSDEEIRDHLITLVLAGHETTASSITWVLLCLQANEDARRALTRELDASGAEDEELAGRPYLEATILETLRLYPVIPVVSREVQAPLQLRRWRLPRGVFATPCAYLAHRRPDVFPDPTAFRPERFLARRYSPYAYFPFGGGGRRCLGMWLALLEMQIVVGTMLRSFRFSRSDRDPVLPVRRGLTIVASRGGRMQVERRAGAAAIAP